MTAERINFKLLPEDIEKRKVSVISAKVAVSDTLSPVKELLHAQGYDVVNLENEEDLSGLSWEDYDFIVVSGMDDNFTGMQDMVGEAVSVIDASGCTPEEVVQEIELRG